MSNLNCVIVSGNLTADPEVRTTQGGTIIAKFRLAINDGYLSSAGDWVNKTHFVDCTCFGKNAEKMGKLVRKGQPLEIQGKLEYSSWETDEGEKRSRLAVTVMQFHLLPKALNPKPQQEAEPQYPAEDHEIGDALSAGAASNGVANHDRNAADDIPF